MNNYVEGAVIAILIVFNGWLSLSEMAIIASHKFHLQQQASKGEKRAKRALFLAENTSFFLSSIQSGVTMVGIFLGVYSGSTIAQRLSVALKSISWFASFHDFLSYLLVTMGITVIVLLFGELVPKKIALSQPEKYALKVSGFIFFLSSIFRPLVVLLSKMTDSILGLFKIHADASDALTEEEIRATMKQGKMKGIFNETEFGIMERVLHLGDRNIQSLMIPRRRVCWVDIKEDTSKILSSVLQASVSHFPLCDGSLDNLLGIVSMKDMMLQWISDKKLDLKKILKKPVVVFENAGALEVLNLFREKQVKIALVIDEYGVIQGIVSFFDYLRAMVGESISWGSQGKDPMVKIGTEKFEMDGMIRMEQVVEVFNLPKEEERYSFLSSTLGGFIMELMGRIPHAGEIIKWGELIFEIKEMHQYRIHRVLITKKSTEEQKNEKEK